MVQIIGLMIGGYILIRMFQFVLRKEESLFVRILSGLNIPIVLFVKVRI